MLSPGPAGTTTASDSKDRGSAVFARNRYEYPCINRSVKVFPHCTRDPTSYSVATPTGSAEMPTPSTAVPSAQTTRARTVRTGIGGGSINCKP